MGIFRKVDVLIWTNNKFRRLSQDGRYAFMFFLTHPNQTSIGAFRATLGGLTDEIGWGEDLLRFRSALAELIDARMIDFDYENRVVFVVNFMKYNPPENPNVVKNWKYNWDHLPAETYIRELIAMAVNHALAGKAESWIRAFPAAITAALPSDSSLKATSAALKTTLRPAQTDGAAPQEADFCFEDGVSFCVGKGAELERARTLIGKLRKEAGDQEALSVIYRCVRQDITGPIAWLNGFLVSRNKAKETGRPGSSLRADSGDTNCEYGDSGYF